MMLYFIIYDKAMRFFTLLGFIDCKRFHLLPRQSAILVCIDTQGGALGINHSNRQTKHF